MSNPESDSLDAAVAPDLVTAHNVDLNNCDREQIHLVGAIQPHGVLLALADPELTILQASANSETYLGIPVDRLLGAPLEVLLGEEGTAALRTCLARTVLDGVHVHLTTLACRPGSAERYHLFGNRAQGFLLLELERAEPIGQRFPGEGFSDVRDLLQRVRSAASLSEFLGAVVERVRALTGFERVMIYRFAPDGSGEVVAESREAVLQPYLGLHYPASDIPAPARRLFALNPLRHLPDVDYVPVPILSDPDLVAADEALLDLSYSALRSLSIMHRDYLRNMGARATLVAPLMQERDVWGLISCMHHSGPRYLPFERRLPVELMAQMVSQLIGDREDLDQYAYRARLDQALSQHIVALGRAQDLHLALAETDPGLLAAIDASGALLISEGRVSLLGKTPSEPQIALILDWLGRQDEPVVSTQRLAQALPATADVSDLASGLLAIRLARATPEWIVWLRPEVLTEVHWAGNPSKPVEISDDGCGARLTPRTSFALWTETVSGQSRPWLACELDYATRLRQAILDVLADRAALLARINAELERSNLELDSFAYAASHDLKEPLRGINHFAEFLQCEESEGLSERARQRLTTIRRLAGRMDHLLESLLQYSRVGRGELERYPLSLQAMVTQLAEVTQQSFPDAALSIRVHDTLPVVGCDRAQVETVFRNLIINAIKYNERTTKEIEIGCDTARDPPVFFVRDNGIGIASDQREQIFQLFRRLHGRDEYGGGMGAGLAITRKAIERHQGRIWVTSEVGRGSTFYFTLAPEREADTQMP